MPAPTTTWSSRSRPRNWWHGRIVPKQDLERLVLGFDSELASNALEVHVSALRRKLGRELIETVRGLGYRVEKPA